DGQVDYRTKGRTADMSEFVIELRHCPNCLDGEVWETCRTCRGRGCPICGEAGEVLNPNPCCLCDGAGQVNRPLACLFDADRWCKRQDPGWDGDPWKHSGATLYSRAAYYRQRTPLKML